jgi:tripartite-type tricarboxylate transporter receptor subunit TctC
MLRFLRFFLLALSLVAGVASAQSYPDKTKTLKIILPQGPGSVSDVMARALAKGISEVTGMNVIVDYKPGAETVLGVQALLQSPADGYSLLMVSSSTPVLNVVMIPNLAYDPFRDFVPLVGYAKNMLALNLGPSTPYKTAREFIAAAKAQPGKLTFASATTAQRLAGELLQANAGIQLLNVPYKTSAQAATALASGEVDMQMLDPVSMRPLWQSGRVRPVAVSGATRMKAMPELPTLREEGVPDYDFTAWFATYFARGTPPEIAERMSDILRRAMKTPGVVETLTQGAMEPLELSGAELTQLARREVDLWNQIAKRAGLKPTQ